MDDEGSFIGTWFGQGAPSCHNAVIKYPPGGCNSGLDAGPLVFLTSWALPLPGGRNSFSYVRVHRVLPGEVEAPGRCLSPSVASSGQALCAEHQGLQSVPLPSAPGALRANED